MKGGNQAGVKTGPQALCVHDVTRVVDAQSCLLARPPWLIDWKSNHFRPARPSQAADLIAHRRKSIWHRSDTKESNITAIFPSPEGGFDSPRHHAD
jgi:hypothetical protein